MEQIEKLQDLPAGIPSVVTIGAFDGVHLGHQAIMRAVTTSAQQLHARSAAVTFDRDPEELVNPSSSTPYITTLHQKLRLIEEQDLDLALILPLSRGILHMAAEEFVETVLCKALSAREVVVGTDFAFGRARAGNVDLLRRLGESLGFGVKVVPPVKVKGIIVSSTAIRALLAEGNIALANERLGHPFVLEGTVVSGDGIGRGIGFPTANLRPSTKQIVPRNGVYKVSVEIAGRTWPGVANIGTRPTVGGASCTIEVHIIGFSGDLYDQQLEVAFEYRLRDEMRFPNLSDLAQQIAQDVEQASRLNETPAHE